MRAKGWARKRASSCVPLPRPPAWSKGRAQTAQSSGFGSGPVHTSTSQPLPSFHFGNIPRVAGGTGQCHTEIQTRTLQPQGQVAHLDEVLGHLLQKKKIRLHFIFLPLVQLGGGGAGGGAPNDRTFMIAHKGTSISFYILCHSCVKHNSHFNCSCKHFLQLQKINF